MGAPPVLLVAPPALLSTFHALPPHHMRRCMTHHNIRKIGVIGDSNGVRYVGAFARLLSPHTNGSLCVPNGCECELQKIEKVQTGTGALGSAKKGARHGALPDTSYFGVPGAVSHYRDCANCFSQLWSCHGRYGGAAGSSTPIALEYLAMDHGVDTEIGTMRYKWGATGGAACVARGSNAESSLTAALAAPWRLSVRTLLI